MHHSAKFNFTPTDAMLARDMLVYEDHHSSILCRAMHDMKLARCMFHSMSDSGLNYDGYVNPLLLGLQPMNELIIWHPACIPAQHIEVVACCPIGLLPAAAATDVSCVWHGSINSFLMLLAEMLHGEGLPSVLGHSCCITRLHALLKLRLMTALAIVLEYGLYGPGPPLLVPILLCFTALVLGPRICCSAVSDALTGSISDEVSTLVLALACLCCCQWPGTWDSGAHVLASWVLDVLCWENKVSMVGVSA